MERGPKACSADGPARCLIHRNRTDINTFVWISMGCGNFQCVVTYTVVIRAYLYTLLKYFKAS